MNLLQNFAQKQYKKEHRIRTDEEVDSFYQTINAPFELKTKLTLMGFTWQGTTSWFDWSKTPAESLASDTRQLNCGSFMMFYTELYNRLGIKYTCYLLQSSRICFWKCDWQYISVFEWQGETWLQSKNTLTKIENEDILASSPKYSRLVYQ